MGRCNPADCNHHVSFRRWHFLCRRTRSSEGRHQAGIPERSSRLVLAMFPGSDAQLSCNHNSGAGSAWLLNIAQDKRGDSALSRKAGLPGFRFHDLRHCAITQLAENGTSDSTIIAIAGHVSRRMLERYSHVRMEAKRNAMEALAVSTKTAGYDTNHDTKAVPAGTRPV